MKCLQDNLKQVHRMVGATAAAEGPYDLRELCMVKALSQPDC
jgi:hypothetical protein